MRRALTQAEIDAAIQEWNGNIESKHAVVRYMKDHAREKDTAAWLRQEYGDDLPALPVTVDGAAGDVPWPKVQRRIVQLIKEDRFYTEAEQDRFDNIDSIAIREALAERGIVNGQVVDPEKLDSDPFIRQVMRDVEAVATEEQAEAAAKPPVPDLSGQPVTREGDTLTIGSGEPPMRSTSRCRTRNMPPSGAPSRSAPPTIRPPRFTMWAIPSIWMTAPIKLPNCGRIRCSCCPPA